MKFLPENVKKIAVFRALHLGSMLCAVPALRALRCAYPAAQITLLGLPEAASFVRRFSEYLDSFIHFPGYPGLPEQDFDLDQWDTFVHKVEEEHFDLIIQMHSNGTIINEMLAQITRTPLAGFHHPGDYMGSEHFLEYPLALPEIDRHLALMQHLGISSQGRQLEFPVTPMEEQHASHLKSGFSSKKYICVHPGSRDAWQQWPASFFAALADECSKMGYSIVVNGAPDEKETVREVISQMQTKAVGLAGKTGLGEAAILIRDALLLISNCTGASQIAAATGTPSIIISMDGEPDRWRLPCENIHRIIDWAEQQNFGVAKKEMEQLIEISTSKPESVE